MCESAGDISRFIRRWKPTLEDLLRDVPRSLGLEDKEKHGGSTGRGGTPQKDAGTEASDERSSIGCCHPLGAQGGLAQEGKCSSKLRCGFDTRHLWDPLADSSRDGDIF